jgi:hypothetical protein
VGSDGVFVMGAETFSVTVCSQCSVTVVCSGIRNESRPHKRRFSVNRRRIEVGQTPNLWFLSALQSWPNNGFLCDRAQLLSAVCLGFINKVSLIVLAFEPCLTVLPQQEAGIENNIKYRVELF